MPLAEDVDADTLAADLGGYSGADIEAVCDEATDRAWDRECASGQRAELTPGDITAAAGRVPPSVEPSDAARYEGPGRLRCPAAAS